MNIELVKNQYWDRVTDKRVSIITPVYNRKEELLRAFESIKNQSSTDFEYIVVNDGSTIDIDDMVINFISNVPFPALYIKKDNGGVHTARNLAIKYARGEMVCSCDSDDELVNTAIETLLNAWDSLKDEDKPLYREICARCIDEKGNEDGPKFPDGINNLPWKRAYKITNKINGEHFGFWKRDTLLNNPWPEPEGITLVNEGVVWNKLSKKYRSYFINDVVLIIHRENDNSYTRSKKSSIQAIKNACWNMAYSINHWRECAKPKISYLKTMVFYITFKQILKRKKISVKEMNLEHLIDKIVRTLLWLFVIPISFRYQKRKLEE